MGDRLGTLGAVGNPFFKFLMLVELRNKSISFVKNGLCAFCSSENESKVKHFDIIFLWNQIFLPKTWKLDFFDHKSQETLLWFDRKICEKLCFCLRSNSSFCVIWQNFSVKLTFVFISQKIKCWFDRKFVKMYELIRVVLWFDGIFLSN